MCSVGGGHGVPDVDTISGRPRQWITSNRGHGDSWPSGPGLLSNGSCSSSVPLHDPTVRKAGL